MNVLITGDRGFIGSHIAEYFAGMKEISVYGWNSRGVYNYAAQESCVANMLDYAATLQVLSTIRPDLIIHCAGNAEVSSSVIRPNDDLNKNYITTHNLLFAMKELQLHKCRFVLLSSAAVYGNPMRLPITEESEINPVSPYALHKKAAEDVCIFMHKNYGFPVKILRIFSVYGPGLRKQIFWDMYCKIQKEGRLDLFGSGAESRDYIYISDLIRAIIAVVESEDTRLIYNVANGCEVTIREAAECFAKHINLPKEKISFAGVRREGDPINWRADITGLQRLGYRRQVSFDEGIRNYIKWVKENPIPEETES